MRTLIADAFKIDNYSLNFNQVQLSDDKTLSAAACLSNNTEKKRFCFVRLSHNLLGI